jgi:hypothetical protein
MPSKMLRKKINSAHQVFPQKNVSNEQLTKPAQSHNWRGFYLFFLHP